MLRQCQAFRQFTSSTAKMTTLKITRCQSPHLLFIFPLLWLVSLIVILMINSFFHSVDSIAESPRLIRNPQVDSQIADLNRRLSLVNNQIVETKTINMLLQQNVRKIDLMKSDKKSRAQVMQYLRDEKKRHSITKAVNDPSFEFESSRRQLEDNINDLWSYLKANLNDTLIKNYVRDSRNSLLVDLETINRRDLEWRKTKLQKLADYVQSTIRRLQNPPPGTCDKTRKIVCSGDKSCGFACRMHHIAYCMIVAMATNRTLILFYKDWSHFEPISETCTDSNGHNKTTWGSKNFESFQVVEIPIIESIRPRPEFLPLYIPSQIAKKLKLLHGNPFVWFIGQILSYIIRPSKSVSQYIDEFKKTNDFKHPLVGVHVRRTDKIGTEAQFHGLDEYMRHVDEFYDRLDMLHERDKNAEKAEPIQRIVYLATDDPEVWQTEIVPFKKRGYVFVGDIDVARSALVHSRERADSQKNIVLDAILLSQTDHLVCTFSSQVCRLAYELMQTRLTPNRVDWSTAFYSLDDVYYFGGQIFHGKLAILNHNRPDDLEFKTGDVLGVANDLHNGFNYGKNENSGQFGNYPRFKVVDLIQDLPFAVFDN